MEIDSIARVEQVRYAFLAGDFNFVEHIDDGRKPCKRHTGLPKTTAFYTT
jgi:hypothetical protein